MKKKFKFSIFILFVFTCLILFNNCDRKEENRSLSLEEKITDIMKPYIKVGAIVGVIYKGERQVFSYGNKSIEGNDPPDIDTVFEIGSITKTFTATILADMNLKDIINLDDIVGDFLPADKVSMPNYNGVEITFRHLATHYSGLPRMPSNIGAYNEDPYALYTKEDMYEFLNNFILAHPPGAEYSYSNLGVGFLGHTLGIIDNTSYEDLLFRNIFNVLGMKNSSLLLTEKQKENLALGHDPDLNITSNWNGNDCFHGAGFIKSSLKDMFKFLEANMGLKDTSLNESMELAQLVQFPDPYGDSVGLIWVIEVISGQRIV
ncbi:serine hydrolase domain-containing protein [Acidobacteriota bacterium]